MLLELNSTEVSCIERNQRRGSIIAAHIVRDAVLAEPRAEYPNSFFVKLQVIAIEPAHAPLLLGTQVTDAQLSLVRAAALVCADVCAQRGMVAQVQAGSLEARSPLPPSSHAARSKRVCSLLLTLDEMDHRHECGLSASEGFEWRSSYARRGWN